MCSSDLGSMWDTRPSIQPSTPDVVREPEAPVPPTPPAPEYVEVTVPPDAVLGLQIERTVSSELARIEDKVEARVTRDVRVGDRIAIPAGSTVQFTRDGIPQGTTLHRDAPIYGQVLPAGSKLKHAADGSVFWFWLPADATIQDRKSTRLNSSH